MSCEFEQEGFCILLDFVCSHKLNGACKIEPDDLVDVCPDCFQLNCDGSCEMEERESLKEET